MELRTYINVNDKVCYLKIILRFQNNLLVVVFDQLVPLKLFSVKLAGTNRPVALAQANAVLNRLDLVCEV